jgi:hypothetical protein
MAKSNYTTTIAIDTNRSAFHFYSMQGNDKKSIIHNTKSYTETKLDESYFGSFKQAVKEFAESTPSDSIRKVSVILPDSAILTDMIQVPTVKGSAQTQKMLDVALGNLYRNYKDLHIVAQLAEQNKQSSTIGITAVQNSIVSAVYSACSENKLLVDSLSFSSAAAIAAATHFNSKLKNASYVFLDIKDTYSRFIFVVDGKVMGFYTLPFGMDFLRKPQVVREETLFNHDYAELVVLNAREKAKSQKLTVADFGADGNVDAADENALAQDQVGEEDAEQEQEQEQEH